MISLLLAYGLGSLPAAFYLARLKGKNIFQTGSKNMGSMNSFRNVGPIIGIAVFLIDVAKGYLAAYLGARHSLELGFFCAAACILGHAFSIWVGFKGGKALACAFGSTLCLVPWLALVQMLSIIALSLSLKRIALASSITTLIFFFSILGISLWTPWQWTPWQWTQRTYPIVLAAAMMSGVVLYKHWPELSQELGFKRLASDSSALPDTSQKQHKETT